MQEMESHVRLVFYSCSGDFERCLHVSAGVENVFGLAPQVLQRHPSAWLELVDEKDLQPLLAEMRRIVEHASEGRFEYRTSPGRLYALGQEHGLSGSQ